jgi:hypothetical protein
MKKTSLLFFVLVCLVYPLQGQRINFSDTYRKAHQGKFTVDVPEVHELANIMVAVSIIGLQDKNMVDMETPYYQEVIKHFMPYHEHPAILKLNEYITEVLGQNSYSYYYNFRMNSCAYAFRNHTIINEGIYEFILGPFNLFAEMLPLTQDFSDRSGFREFYAAHETYYASLVEKYNRLCPVDKMWRWIEREFPQRYQGYKVIFSPLIFGAHSTQHFSADDYNETIMFINAPSFRKGVDELSDEEKEARLSRIALTEIDHNYVNPTTDRYSNEVERVMRKIECWNTRVQGYNSFYETFNEYMTWAIFTLYLEQNFDAALVEKRNDAEAAFMVSRRGFNRFKEFNNKLREVYKNKKDHEHVSDLFEPMLKWMGEQSCE